MTYTRMALWLLLVTCLAQAAFAAVPALDLWVAGLFYDPARGFWLRDDAVLHRVRSVLMGAVWVLGLPALALALAAALGRGRYLLGARPWIFFSAGLILGPGLLVNGLLKAYWGRARPDDITVFGGDAQFTPPFQITDQCLKNCSFTSGEAASAATLAMLVLVLAWPRASRLVRGALLASLVPVAMAGSAFRIVMGRHFLSDVVFSILLCALVLLALHRLLGLGRSPSLTLPALRHDALTALSDLADLPRRLWRRGARPAPHSSHHQTSGSQPVQSP